VPKDFPVKPLRTQRQKDKAKYLMTCCTCGRSWDNAIITGLTPVPAARCPFEYFHKETKHGSIHP
jgi:hypothetical protein